VILINVFPHHSRISADESEVGIHGLRHGASSMGELHPQEEHTVLLTLLRQVRLDAKLRQVDLAERLGQPQSFVSKYESGERRLDILELRSLCKLVGISLEQFVAKLEERLP
jgi:DNA-binding transcriptional regulator YiaG